MKRSDTGEHHEDIRCALDHVVVTQIAANNPLLSQNGLDPNAVKTLFNQLMAVNPSVEVYLLDKEGNIVGNAAPAGKLQRQRIDLAPVHALLNGAQMPVYGDNPRTQDARQAFSAAPLKANGVTQGYVYISLQSDDYTALAGALAFRWVTRPVRKLTAQIAHLDAGGMAVVATRCHHSACQLACP
jgi:hypothetical protein